MASESLGGGMHWDPYCLAEDAHGDLAVLVLLQYFYVTTHTGPNYRVPLMEKTHDPECGGFYFLGLQNIHEHEPKDIFLGGKCWEQICHAERLYFTSYY